MVPTGPRLCLALVALVFVCALALTGVIVNGRRGEHFGAVPTGSIRQGWPVKYLDAAVPLTGVLQRGGDITGPGPPLSLNAAPHNPPGGTTMDRHTARSRRVVVTAIAVALALGGVLFRPGDTLAGFGSSPGSPRAAVCDAGKHFPGVILTVRKAGEGQLDFG